MIDKQGTTGEPQEIDPITIPIRNINEAQLLIIFSAINAIRTTKTPIIDTINIESLIISNPDQVCLLFGSFLKGALDVGYKFPLNIYDTNNIEEKNLLNNVKRDSIRQIQITDNDGHAPFYLVLLRSLTPIEATFIRDWLIYNTINYICNRSQDEIAFFLKDNPQLQRVVNRFFENHNNNLDKR